MSPNFSPSAVQDYTPFFTNLPVTFTTSPDRMCVEISIIDDNAAEPDEPFPVLLTSDDPAAQLGPITTTTILISDAVGQRLYNYYWHLSQRKSQSHFINVLYIICIIIIAAPLL